MQRCGPHPAGAAAAAGVKSVASLLRNGLFRAAMRVCGEHNHPRVAEPAVTLLDTLLLDATSARKHLVRGKPAREALDAAIESCRATAERKSRARGGGGGGGGGSLVVFRRLTALAKLADTFDAKTFGEAGGASRSAENSASSLATENMCRWCSKSESRDGAKLTRCGGCLRVYYCSKACQVRDWKEGGHKQLCKETIASAAGSGKSLRQAASDVTTMKQMLFDFLRSNARRVLRKMWELAAHAVETGAADACGVDGGGDRLSSQPRLRDFLVSVDFGSTARAWSVHLVSGFISERDVPDWISRAEAHGVMRGAVEAELAKLQDDQILSVVYAPNQEDCYCFRTSMHNPDDPANTGFSDAMISEQSAFPMDQAPPGGGFRNWGKIDLSSAEIAAMLGDTAPRRAR